MTLTLSAPGGGAVLGPRSTAQLKIVDDEAAVQFASPTYSVLEGGTIAITVERTGAGDGDGDRTVHDGRGDRRRGHGLRRHRGRADIRGGDEDADLPGADAGQHGGRRRPHGRADAGPGGDGDGGAALGSQSTATLTITDNDVGGQIQFSAATYTVSEATAVATITVVRTGGAAGSVTVDFATIGRRNGDGRGRLHGGDADPHVRAPG